MFGDILRKSMHKFEDASKNKRSENAFWKILRDIAVEEIKNHHPQKIDSAIAIDAYYSILKKNEFLIPEYFKGIMKSNKQERYRVINRNLWSSNSSNQDGLASQPFVIANKMINEERNGYKVIYSWGGENDIK